MFKRNKTNKFNKRCWQSNQFLLDFKELVVFKSLTQNPVIILTTKAKNNKIQQKEEVTQYRQEDV